MRRDAFAGRAAAGAVPALRAAALGDALIAAVTVAAALGGPVLGVLLDRTARPGRLLAVALTLHGTGLPAILVGIGRLPVAVCVLIAVLTGIPGPALSGGWTAQLPRVVPRDHLVRANALDAMTFALAGLLGPALAGAAAQAYGAPASAVLIGLAVPAAWGRPPKTDPRTTRRPPPRSANSSPAYGSSSVPPAWPAQPSPRSSPAPPRAC